MVLLSVLLCFPLPMLFLSNHKKKAACKVKITKKTDAP